MNHTSQKSQLSNQPKVTLQMWELISFWLKILLFTMPNNLSILFHILSQSLIVQLASLYPLHRIDLNINQKYIKEKKIRCNYQVEY